MMRQPIDVEKTIIKTLSRINIENIEAVFYYKVDDLGDITTKEGYAINNSLSTNRKSIIFLDKDAPDISKLKVTISKYSGEVYRNSVWFPTSTGTKDELLIKAIELFQKSKSDQLVKLQAQVSDINKSIHRLDVLKDHYKKKLDKDDNTYNDIQIC